MGAKKDKGRLPPFVPLLKDTLDAPAWKAMSHGAKALYIALKRRYNLQSHNNGRLYLSHRQAVKEIRSSSNQVTRWFRELQYYGFIVMQKPGGLGVYGNGKAPCWRLTELGYMKEPPTRDFIRWNGVWFSKHQPGGDQPKKQKPAAENGGGLERKRGTLAQRKRGTFHGTSAAEKGDKGTDQSAAEKGSKSSIPLGWRVGGVDLEVRPSNLSHPLMTALLPDGNKPRWHAPQFEACQITALSSSSGLLS